MDFLGIPGLLEPDQVRELLHSRTSERAKGRRRAPRARHRRRADHARAARRAPARAQRAGRRLAPPHRARPTAITHAALRKECGGPAAAVASADQLHARINRVREWAVKKTS